MAKILEFKVKPVIVIENIFAAVPYKIELDKKSGMYTSIVNGNVLSMGGDLDRIVGYTEQVIGYFVSNGQKV